MCSILAPALKKDRAWLDCGKQHGHEEVQEKESILTKCHILFEIFDLTDRLQLPLILVQESERIEVAAGSVHESMFAACSI
jgi:hypothetical protein